jgi:hypothetical protein
MFMRGMQGEETRVDALLDLNFDPSCYRHSSTFSHCILTPQYIVQQ